MNPMKRTNKQRLWQWAMASTLIVTAAAVHAEFSPRADPLADRELDNLRGGFLVGGMEIAIGLEQIITIDGQTEVVNQLFIPNLNSLSSLAAIGPIVSERLGSQLGVTTSLQGTGVLTHIQNSLDDRVIQNLRSLNIELSNVGQSNGLPAGVASHLLQSPGH